MADGARRNIGAEPIPEIRKPARRSPTTGHRRKKTELKRSQSSSREITENVSIENSTNPHFQRRSSLSPERNEPKKTLRRKHRIKEKEQSTCEDSEPLKNIETETSLGHNEISEPFHSDSIKNEEIGKEEKLQESTEETDGASEENHVHKLSIFSWWSLWNPWRRVVETDTEIKSSKENLNTEPPESNSSEIERLSIEDNDISSEFVKIVESLECKTEIPQQVQYSPLSRFLRETKIEFLNYTIQYPEEVELLKKLRNRCISELLIIIIVCGLGGFIFRFTEGAFETFYKCGVKRVKRDFIEELWRGSHFLKEEEWKSKARRKLREFENQLQEAYEAGMMTYSGRKSWTFINSALYCLTVLTTIGYGHIAPVTTTGRALTIAYAIIGIPLFLILLADFGKLFTRGIKFLWAFVRRLYYTGSCRKVRRTAPVQEVMKGMQMVVDTLRRPSVFTGEGNAENRTPATPGDIPTPALSSYAVDDEFNLPISVAIVILLGYIFLGATVFYIWEDEWTFFESFYFVFISMSTIGFGDLVPQNQMYMMASIVYLAFGLALTSMCINVVQEKLSDTFRKASAKIGATIGLTVSNDDGTISPVLPTNVEIAEVHSKHPTEWTAKQSYEDAQIPPSAIQTQAS